MCDAGRAHVREPLLDSRLQLYFSKKISTSPEVFMYNYVPLTERNTCSPKLIEPRQTVKKKKGSACINVCL